MFSMPFFVAITIIFGTKLALAADTDAKASYLDGSGFTCFKALNKCFKASLTLNGSSGSNNKWNKF
jgi:hypothetical protein